MIAASSSKEYPSDIIKLTLSLYNESPDAIPDSLKEHFINVYNQAIRLIDSGNFSEKGNWLPEAISLALIIRESSTDEHQSYEEITNLNNLEPEFTNQLLDRMSAYIAS